ncbi:MAG: glycosyltransferase family 1 protein [Chitinophagaceae bacterium]|nr:MAG: glycosyltransferase family 1 protein [Chitinophagaceae bacterium]
MNVVFVCGSLEPGKDGVGDYTRRLAGELCKQGHSAFIIALNDKAVKSDFSGKQSVDGVEIDVLRLSATNSWQPRLASARVWLEEKKPDWLSLQYVPFSFHKKGLPWKLSSLLKELGKDKNWHFMFHELWVGMNDGTELKQRLWGRTQQFLIRSMVSSIRPRIVHTHVQLYQQLLKNIGIPSQLLPLFSNVPKEEHPNIGTQRKKKDALDVSFLLFGGIHPAAPIEHLAQEAAQFQKQTSKKVSLTLIGRNGQESERWQSVWERAGLGLNVLGMQETAVISKEMQKATVGIATTPLLLIEKSGSVATMLEHGLPVLCLSKPWTVAGFVDYKIPSGVFEYRPGILESLLDKKPTVSTCNMLSDVSTTFIESLKATK